MSSRNKQTTHKIFIIRNFLIIGGLLLCSAAIWAGGGDKREAEDESAASGAARKLVKREGEHFMQVTTEQQEAAKLFATLHVKGNPLVLPNVWDVGSAKAIAESNAKALATSSWAVAAASGYEDGEKIPFERVIENVQRITKNVHLPVSVDIEGAYSYDLRTVADNIEQIIHTGAIGINFEDQIIGGKGLYSIEDQCARIKAIRERADLYYFPLFINARTDIFFQDNELQHADLVEEAIKRSHAYARSGANCLFVPGLKDHSLIQALCERSPLPVNIMLLSDEIPVVSFAKLGVARVSYGPSTYLKAMEALKILAHKLVH